jgi:hypothetical protein
MSEETPRISPIEVTKEIALDKCKFFADIHVWPLHSRLDPDRWLANFNDDEMPYAIHMLHSFLYFSEHMVEQMLCAAFQGLGKFVISCESDFAAAQTQWTKFRNIAKITWIPGEIPSEADSGHVFVRKARQVLGINEENLLSPSDTVNMLSRSGPCPVVFVDDFVGSGEQCVKGWKTVYPDSGVSFEVLALQPGYSLYYSPLICTHDGYQRLRDECKGLIVNAAHVLPKNYSLLAPDSAFWPDSLRSNAVDVIKTISTRVGIPDTDGAHVNDWQGFHKLGLGLAFYDSVPDATLATLPIFYWEQNGWKPLIRRS